MHTKRAEMFRAFTSLALTQRRISWVYRKWAVEPGANETRRDTYASEARRLWREAKGHIEIARRYKDAS
jgi:hypothetical protein